MKGNELVSSIVSLLKLVIDGKSTYSDLQNLVEDAVAQDKVSVLSAPALALVFDLQKDLELIAVRQATSNDRASNYSHRQIAEQLTKYVEPFSQFSL
ncbi:MAG TPA: hypothetical protein VKE95_18955 [Burkholderiales bacterium]|nr:hypothetical protein [Burkholderiales bacterium]